jgi:cytochrome c oxidase subunit IV
MNKYIDAYNTMGNSGVELIDFIFKVCVILLVDLAELLNISYEALNIIIFILIQPLLILLFFILWQYEKRINSQATDFFRPSDRYRG